MQQASELSQGLESTESLDVVRAYRKINLARLEHALKRAQLIAARRSGARGWDARAELTRVEGLVQESRGLVDQDDGEISSDAIEKETEAALELFADVQSYLEVAEASNANARARSLLVELGFSDDMVNSPYDSLSGGWKMRCELASTLFQRPEILLLDEPTNFLDLPAVIGLQNYLKECPYTVVVVTHDRDFADAVADEVIVLREQKLEGFDGNLSMYVRDRDAKIKQMSRMKEAQDKKTSHIEKTIENNVAAAKRSGDDKKLKQAVSRKKKLDDRMGMEVSAKGTRFKLSRDMGEKGGTFHLTSRSQIEIPRNDSLVKMTFPTTPPDLPFPGALVSLNDVSFRHCQAKNFTLQNVNFAIHLGDRVGLVGANGTGKSTLVKLAVGEAAFAPTTGTVTRHPRLRIGYFSQHATEELEQLSSSDTGRSVTALSHLMEIAGGDLQESKARALLGGMGLPGRLASEVPIADLSGGQRVRLALAKLMWSPPQLLVLDEVTTHLDADTIVALVIALKKFAGAVLCVTHDRFFMRCAIEGQKISKPGEDEEDNASSDSDEEIEETRRRTVFRMFKGNIRELPRGMAQYEEIAGRSAEKRAK